MENNQTNEKQQDYELQAVPDSARKGFLPMFMIMMGFTFFSASMSVGGQLGIGLNMTKFIWALLIGNAILGAYTGILGYMGCKTGLTLDLMARQERFLALFRNYYLYTDGMVWRRYRNVFHSCCRADWYSGGSSCYSGWWSYDSLSLFWY